MTPPGPPPDLLARATELVAIPSVSHHEEALADHVAALLSGVAALKVDRVGNNVVARTELGRSSRLLLAGHLDTVPPNGNETPERRGDQVVGLGATDMKGGLAVMVELALACSDPAVDVTWVFYACEEVDQAHSGLRQLASARPELLEADAAVLGEPTGGRIEAGCQGNLRLGVTLVGERAHTARPWMGVNAIHRLAPLVSRASAYEGRRPVLDGCEYREALQAVRVEGGVANNVVPDRVRVTFNHRFAPDRDAAGAEAHLRGLLAPALAAGDVMEVEEVAPAAPPGLDHPLLAALVARSQASPRAKLGWTDVAFFAGRGVPAANLGPGDPTRAHTAGEFVDRGELEAVHRLLEGVLATGP
ncbi:MAG TPA: succinyl-diaminopimelate desuccinylase [Acidimicrobiales bacterium]|nr:succinyl-diaminopimelate desuccinylase [Acidimicrobiales bacterium]